MGGDRHRRTCLHYGLFGLVFVCACDDPGPARVAQARLVPSPAPAPAPDKDTPTPPHTERSVADPPAPGPSPEVSPPVVDDPPEPEPPATATRIDPRDIPAGTPPDNARAFRKLPVSVHDGPPIGGIGKTGIHIDRVWLGSKYGRRGCEGEADNFATDSAQVNVCFRVVHNREPEQVTVLWEKESGEMVKRRRGVQIPAQHAYRSRAYLALRHEYAGRWRVRIISDDNVELASTSFTVVND